MVPFFPKQITYRAIITYLIALVVIAIVVTVLLCIRRSKRKKEAALGVAAAKTEDLPSDENKTE